MKQAYDEIWLGKSKFPNSLKDAFLLNIKYINESIRKNRK